MDACLTFARWLSKSTSSGTQHAHAGRHQVSLKSRPTSQISAPIIEIQLLPLSSSPSRSGPSAKDHLSKTMPSRQAKSNTPPSQRHYPTILLPGGSCTPVMFMVLDGDRKRRTVAPTGDPSLRWSKQKAAKRRPAILDVNAIFGPSSGSIRNEASKAKED